MAYSIYLPHMLVLLLALRALQFYGVTEPHAQFFALSGATLVATLMVSRLSYRFVELPFHNYGRRLGSGLLKGAATENRVSVS